MDEVEWVRTTGMMMSKNGIQFELQKLFVRRFLKLILKNEKNNLHNPFRNTMNLNAKINKYSLWLNNKHV